MDTSEQKPVKPSMTLVACVKTDGQQELLRFKAAKVTGGQDSLNVSGEGAIKILQSLSVDM